jgi:hypothetical protein
MASLSLPSEPALHSHTPFVLLVISYPVFHISPIILIQYQGERERQRWKGGDRDVQGVNRAFGRRGRETGEREEGKRCKRDIPKFPPQDPSILGNSFALAT